jgi:toxin ParE1/3/4
MEHSVRITPETEADLIAIGDFIAQDSPDNARRFLAKLRAHISTLKHFPARHGTAPEAEHAGVDLRQLIHGMYRVLYTFDDKQVIVHAVRHGARRPMRRDQIMKRL